MIPGADTDMQRRAFLAVSGGFDEAERCIFWARGVASLMLAAFTRWEARPPVPAEPVAPVYTSKGEYIGHFPVAPSVSFNVKIQEDGGPA